MTQSDLRKLDLNLLKAFDALMRHRSVSRAAVELGVGQSGMSQALSRLRRTFDDPLFTRTSEGMTPTKRAEEISDSVRAALSTLAQIFKPIASFDPCGRQFQLTVGMSDFTEALLLPAIIRAFAETGANVLLKVAQIDLVDVLGELDGGKINLAIGQFPKAMTWHRREALFRDRRICLLASTGERDVKTTLSLDEYLARRHV